MKRKTTREVFSSRGRMEPLPILFLFVLVDVLGFSIVLPLLPYLTEQYGMSATTVGLLQASNALAQLVAVPIIGGLSDQWGRKPLLILCVFGTFISFVILALANSPFWLFFSRILDGIIGGNISLAQAYIADVTTEETRSKGMGYLGAAFGFGFILGPAAGGILVKYGYHWPSCAAAALSFINLVCVVLFLPESLPKEKRMDQGDKSLGYIFNQLLVCIKQRRVALLLWMRFLYLVVFTMFETVFSYFNLLRLGLNARESSFLLCWFGLMFAAVQGGGIKSLKKRFDEGTMLGASLKVLVVTYVLYALTTDSYQQIVVLIPLGMASGLANTLITTRVTHEVDQTLMGGALGVSAALGSLTRIISPPAGGWLIDQVGPGFPFYLCAIVCAYLITVEWNLAAESEPKKEVEESGHQQSNGSVYSAHGHVLNSVVSSTSSTGNSTPTTVISS
eukprot:TRINITY_DN4730_c0_g1_i1.p1 TRINITY_DN4730_c0_g1~~TRINITY_DN4730_c0_g1_i1.p1  ORF type:complete len:449 (-),score=71.94 TRINITY_DN4730_c0_g1_i1:74-1420(-)